MTPETVQMAQRLTTLAALSEDPGLGPKMYVGQLTDAYNSTPGI